MHRAMVVCIIFWLGAGLTASLADPDLYWHITIGRWITSNWQIPRVEMWNQFALGQPFIAYSWSNELVFGLIEKVGGLTGLFVAQCALAMSLASCFVWLMTRLSTSLGIGLILGAATLFGMYANFALRPQTVVWIYFAVALFFSNLILNKGWSWKIVICLMVCMTLWANTHITTVLGIASIILWTWQGLDAKKRLLLFFLLCVSTLITPYFGQEWITFFSKIDHPIAHSSIVEFGPGTILDAPVGVLLIVWCFVGVLAWTAPQAVEIHLVALAAFYSASGLAVVKFLPFGHILTAAVAARLWQRGNGAPLRAGLEFSLTRISQLGVRFSGPGLGFVFLVLGALEFPEHYQKLVDDINYPVEAMNIFIEKDLPYPLLNAFGQGGYVMYRLSDEHGNLAHPVPIDGRTNINSKEATTTSSEAFYGSELWRDYFTLVKPQSVVWQNGSPLVAILLATNQWCRIHRTGKITRSGNSLFITKAEYLKRPGLLSDNCG